jgi:hypothetical protein
MPQPAERSKPAGLDKLAHRICRRDRVTRSRDGKLDPSPIEKSVEPNKQCVGSLAAKRCEGFIDLSAGCGIDHLEF